MLTSTLDDFKPTLSQLRKTDPKAYNQRLKDMTTGTPNYPKVKKRAPSATFRYTAGKGGTPPAVAKLLGLAGPAVDQWQKVTADDGQPIRLVFVHDGICYPLGGYFNKNLPKEGDLVFRTPFEEKTILVDLSRKVAKASQGSPEMELLSWEYSRVAPLLNQVFDPDMIPVVIPAEVLKIKNTYQHEIRERGKKPVFKTKERYVVFKENFCHIVEGADIVFTLPIENQDPRLLVMFNLQYLQKGKVNTVYVKPAVAKEFSGPLKRENATATPCRLGEGILMPLRIISDTLSSLF